MLSAILLLLYFTTALDFYQGHSRRLNLRDSTCTTVYIPVRTSIIAKAAKGQCEELSFSLYVSYDARQALRDIRRACPWRE